MLRNKNVLVTGGAGFIGSHLVDALAAAGVAQLVAVDNLYLGRQENLAQVRASHKQFTFHKTDASDLGAMRQIIERHNIEVVFDLAVVPLPASLTEPKWSVDQNVLVTTTLCELARLGLYKTLIHFSSSEALGSAQQVPMSEEHPLEPTTPYAASKAAGDHIVLSYCRTFGIDAAILRPFNNFGPRQNDKAYAGIIPIVVRSVQSGKPITIFGDGEQTRDFIYAADTADAAIAMYNCPETRGRITHIGSGYETSVNHLVSTLLRLMKAESHPLSHGPERPADVRRHCADISLARKLFNFQPQTSLEEGLRRTVEWYLSTDTPPQSEG